MRFANFYPGPSKLDPVVESSVKYLLDSGIVEYNHRSVFFSELYKEIDMVLKDRLNIPIDYSLFFLSSASECWEVVVQSLLTDCSQFFYNGAFGEKWYKYGVIIPQVNVSTVGEARIRGTHFFIDQLITETELDTSSKFVGVVSCETSNGTFVSNAALRKIRADAPSALIGIDATANMGGEEIDFSVVDVAFASVQKCFGLPAGMGIMVCSPRSIEAAKAIGENNHYNSLVVLEENYRRYQTHITPNILNIALLNEVVKSRPNIREVAKSLKQRANRMYELFDSAYHLKPLVKNRQTRSSTILCIKCSNPSKVLELAYSEQILLGSGYGEWRDETFRIANFPAHTDQEFEWLEHFISRADASI